MVSITQKNLIENRALKRAGNSISFGNGVISNGGIARVFSSEKLSRGFEYIKQNPVAEVVGLDITTMIAPRTVIDYKQNPNYGIETFFRETVPILFNPFGPGIAAALMMKSKGYSGIYANSQAIKSLDEAWKQAGGKNFNPKALTDPKQVKIVEQYAKTVLQKTEGFIGTTKNNAFKPLSEKELKGFSSRLASVILENNDKKTISKELKKIAVEYTEKTGAAKSLNVNLGKSFSTNINMLLDNTVYLGKRVFAKTLPEKVKGVVDDLVKFSTPKTLLATGISIAGIFSFPYINKAITKKRTGENGYCAYQDFGRHDIIKPANININVETEEEKKKSSDLWKAKGLAAAGMGAIMLTTIGAFGKKGFFNRNGLKNFMNKIELKEKYAHLDLIKLVYGTSIMGRIFSSRDKQEVKTTAVRDYAGFLNWLVLGGVVTKGVAYLADTKNKSFINVTGELKGKNWFQTAKNFLGNVSSKTPGEVRAMSQKLSPKEQLRNKIVVNGSIAAGIAYAMLALGIGMPILNNYMTNKAREKQLKNGENAQNEQNDNIYSSGLLNNSVHLTSFSGLSEKNKNLYGNFILN